MKKTDRARVGKGRCGQERVKGVGCRWLMFVMLAAQVAEIRKIMV
jgi:hypothetical protein